MKWIIGVADLPKEYYEWFRAQDFSYAKPAPTPVVKQLVESELQRFKAMSTEEYVLWQKWEEVNDLYPMQDSILTGEWAHLNTQDGILIQKLRNSLWDGDYRDIKPELLWIGDKKNESIKDHWSALRVLIHTQQNSGAIGRCLNYLVRDSVSKRYLGLIAIASDFLDLGGRDEVIGWTREQRTQEQRVRYTAVCSTIVPVQPFGYNYLGGKLLALLCLSEQVQKDWKEQYGSRLVGLTTTSLYGKDKKGGLSQYDNLKYWKKMGYSQGSTALRVSRNTKGVMYDWAYVNIPEDYYMFMEHKDEKGMTVRDRQNRFHQRIYRRLGISNKLFTSNHDRGIYFAPLYKNAYEFLRNEIPEEQLIKEHDFSIEALTELWREKYAARRAAKLAQTRRQNRALFYDDLATMSWEDAKMRYLRDVGR